MPNLVKKYAGITGTVQKIDLLTPEEYVFWWGIWISFLATIWAYNSKNQSETLIIALTAF